MRSKGYVSQGWGIRNDFRLRQDAPCVSTGRISVRQRLLLDREGDRQTRRSRQGARPRPTSKAMADGVRSSATAEGREARGASLLVLERAAIKKCNDSWRWNLRRGDPPVLPPTHPRKGEVAGDSFGCSALFCTSIRYREYSLVSYPRTLCVPLSNSVR